MGIIRRDAGKIWRNGQEVEFSSPAEALASGVAIIEQELSPIPQMTVAENIFLGREPPGRFGGVDFRKMNAAAQAILDDLDDLGAKREISRIVGDFAAAGGTVAMISSEIDELLGVADRIMVMRDGRAVDILVNCAGVVFLAPAATLPLDYWDKTIAVNLKGTFLMSQTVGKAMIAAARGGKIVNIASQCATVAIDEHVAYCASKFGVVGLSKVLAAEWAKHHICVNTISPTVVMTELGKKAWDNPKGEALKLRIPAGRFALPEDIAAAAVFLASNGADMVNGADLLVDGGYTIV